MQKGSGLVVGPHVQPCQSTRAGHSDSQELNKSSRKLIGRSRELFTVLKWKKREVRRRWKQKQGTQDKYTDTVLECRDGDKKAKSYRQVETVRDTKGKKDFSKCSGGRKKAKKNVEHNSNQNHFVISQAIIQVT